MLKKILYSTLTIILIFLSVTVYLFNTAWQPSFGFEIKDGAVYLDEKKFNADPATFEKLSDNYVKDKKYVWYVYTGKSGVFGHPKEHHTVLISNANPITFEILSSGYTKDDKNVYAFGSTLRDANPNTFEILSFGFAKDDKNIYYHQNKLLDVDYLSFQTLPRRYFKDKNNVYYCGVGVACGSIVEDADVDSFELLIDDYFKDNYHVYCKGSRVVEADPETFEILKNKYSIVNYAKDNKNVYYGNCNIESNSMPIKMESADPISFKVLESGYSKDKNYVYYETKILGDIDAKTFEVLNIVYAKDKKNIYVQVPMGDGSRKIKIVDKADVDTFEVIEYSKAKDKNNYYKFGKIIINPFMK